VERGERVEIEKRKESEGGFFSNRRWNCINLFNSVFAAAGKVVHPLWALRRQDFTTLFSILTNQTYKTKKTEPPPRKPILTGDSQHNEKPQNLFQNSQNLNVLNG